MPNAGDNVLIETDDKMKPSWYGVFAGYDTQTENYIIEDCYFALAPDRKISKKFFNKRFTKSITVLN